MNVLGLVYAIVASVTWGIVYTIDQKILVTLSPIVFIFYSAILTIIITLPIIYLTSGFAVIGQLNKNTIGLFLLTIILGILANLFIFSGIKVLGASKASIFEISYPFFVVIFSLIFFGGSFNLWFWLGSILIFIGSSIIIIFS